jgi:hypothetical protein
MSNYDDPDQVLKYGSEVVPISVLYGTDHGEEKGPGMR